MAIITPDEISTKVVRARDVLREVDEAIVATAKVLPHNEDLAFINGMLAGVLAGLDQIQEFLHERPAILGGE